MVAQSCTPTSLYALSVDQNAEQKVVMLIKDRSEMTKSYSQQKRTDITSQKILKVGK